MLPARDVPEWLRSDVVTSSFDRLPSEQRQREWHRAELRQLLAGRVVFSEAPPDWLAFGRHQFD